VESAATRAYVVSRGCPHLTWVTVTHVSIPGLDFCPSKGSYLNPAATLWSTQENDKLDGNLDEVDYAATLLKKYAYFGNKRHSWSESPGRNFYCLKSQKQPILSRLPFTACSVQTTVNSVEENALIDAGSTLCHLREHRMMFWN